MLSFHCSGICFSVVWMELVTRWSPPKEEFNVVVLLPSGAGRVWDVQTENGGLPALHWGPAHTESGFYEQRGERARAHTHTRTHARTHARTLFLDSFKMHFNIFMAEQDFKLWETKHSTFCTSYMKKMKQWWSLCPQILAKLTTIPDCCENALFCNSQYIKWKKTCHKYNAVCY